MSLARNRLKPRRIVPIHDPWWAAGFKYLSADSHDLESCSAHGKSHRHTQQTTQWWYQELC